MKHGRYEMTFLLFAVLWAFISVSTHSASDNYSETIALFSTFLTAMSQVLLVAVLIKLLFESLSSYES